MWKRLTNPRGSARTLRLLLLPVSLGLLAVGCSAPPVHDVAAGPLSVTSELQGDYQAALALMQAEQWREAAGRLGAITQQEPRLAGPWLNLGIARTMLGETDAAEAAFRESLSRKAINPVACNQLGMLYRRSGRLEEARAMYNAALEVAPDDPDTHWNLGILYDRYLPDAPRALQHYERYQALTGSQDPRLQAWIDALRKRTQAPAMTAEARP